MAHNSPPKPWEKRGAPVIAASPLPGPTLTPSPAMSNPTPNVTSSMAVTTSASSGPPTLPSRPTSLNSLATNPTSSVSPYSAYNQSRFNSTYGVGTGFGSYGSYGSYSSPYSRFGSYGTGMYGGMGGYGGYGAFGTGPLGGDPNDPNSLMRGMESNTAATFQMIESIVGAFGGFAQMLESTFMATHSSFFAMVQVAEQFGNLRNTLGQILGIFTVMRWAKMAFAKLTGRPIPAATGELTPASFAAFSGTSTGGKAGLPRPSKKPFFFFLLAVFGLPYLMGKLIRTLASKQEEEHRRQLAAAGLLDAQGNPINPVTQVMDPSSLEFARCKFDYTPENSQAGIDLEVKKGDLIAILSKTDPMGNPSQWWKCRARDSRIGYLPSPYLEIIVRKPKVEPKQIEAGNSAGDASRAATMNSVSADLVQAQSDIAKANPKSSDLSLEAFQKSQFYT